MLYFCPTLMESYGFPILVVASDTVSSMFSHAILGKYICLIVCNPVSRVWGQCSTSSKNISSGTVLEISVAHSTALLMVNFWEHIIEL